MDPIMSIAGPKEGHVISLNTTYSQRLNPIET